MKTLGDYGFVRGVCHNPTLEPEAYDRDPEGYLSVVETFVDMCAERDITVMPIIWNGNFITDFTEPDEDWYARAKAYAKDVMARLGGKGKIRTYVRRLFSLVRELARKHRVGWYVFDLVSEGFWGDIHGLVYPDGTIRDPAVIAALFGFFRNRNGGRIPVNPNKEGHADRAVKMVAEAFRRLPEEERDIYEIRDFACGMARILSEKCHILQAAFLRESTGR